MKGILRLIKRQLIKILGRNAVDRIQARYDRIHTYYNKIRDQYDRIYDKVYVRFPWATKLQRELGPNFKIGMAVLAHERPEYLEVCLDSLFQTKLYDYDITFLIQDDGSTDPRVREIIERKRDPRYKIIRYFTPKGHNSWGAAFNKAVRRLLEIDDFDIIGSCDADVLFHPDWLEQTMKICLWAKKNHKDNILGPFSSFNSSDYEFHRILGTYDSPYGRYVVKRRMGAVNYFFFKDDLLRLGFFDEHRDDETLMTQRFETLRVRNFCTETSYVEHIGTSSILNQWRPTPVTKPVYGMNLAKHGWPSIIERIGTLGYYKYVKESVSTGDNVSSQTTMDIIIPVAEKDLDVLPYAIDGVRENLRHPIGRIIIIAPDSQSVRALCADKHCEFVLEDTVLPIRRKDIAYTVDGLDRSGWLFQQLLKWGSDSLSSQEYYLVLDADTVLIRPQIFEINGQVILLHSDEHHQPYFDVYKKLLGVDPPTPLSFISHHILYRKCRIAELKRQLEQRHQGTPWYYVILATIDKSEISAISEYEIYGQWMLQNHGDEVIREYWFNKALSRAELKRFSKIAKELSKKYRSVSFHSYLH